MWRNRQLCLPNFPFIRPLCALRAFTRNRHTEVKKKKTVFIVPVVSKVILDFDIWVCMIYISEHTLSLWHSSSLLHVTPKIVCC
jgi:hypothetical protein